MSGPLHAAKEVAPSTSDPQVQDELDYHQYTIVAKGLGLKVLSYQDWYDTRQRIKQTHKLREG